MHKNPDLNKNMIAMGIVCLAGLIDLPLILTVQRMSLDSAGDDVWCQGCA